MCSVECEDYLLLFDLFCFGVFVCVCERESVFICVCECACVCVCFTAWHHTNRKRERVNDLVL